MRASVRSLAVLLLLTLPMAQAATVAVPEMVLQTSVPFAVSAAAAGSTVNLTVGSVSRQFTSVSTADTFTVTGVPTGWQSWAARVTTGATTESFSGRVYVDPAVSSLTTSLAALTAQLTALQAQLAGVNVTAMNGTENLTALQLRMNVTVTQILDAVLAATTGGANLEANVTEAMRRAARDVLAAATPIAASDLDEVKASSSVAGTKADSAASWALYATIAAGAATLMMVAVGLFLFRQLERTRGDFLVYVLALAAHSGITPQSPEFQQALEATGHKPKEPKAPRKERLKKGKDKKAGGNE